MISKAIAASKSLSHFAATGPSLARGRKDWAYPCTLRRVWLKRHSVLLGLPPRLIAAGPCRLPQAQVLGRRSSSRTRFAQAREEPPRSTASVQAVPPVLSPPHPPPGCPPSGRSPLRSKRLSHRSEHKDLGIHDNRECNRKRLLRFSSA